MQFPLQTRKIIRGAAEHIKAGLGAATDYVADYVPLYAPRDGIVSTYYGTQGGNWLSIIFNDGYTMKFAHLSKYIIKSGSVKQGQLLATTGNTGTITTGPHLHLEVYDPQGRRMDPELYLRMYTFKLTIVNPKDTQALKDAVLKYSRGFIQLEVTELVHSVSAVNVLTNDETIKLFHDLGIRQGAMIYYHDIGTQQYQYGITYFDTVVNVPVIAIDERQETFSACYEVSHAVQKLYNATRPIGAPSVSIEDIFTPDEAFLYRKFDAVTPYLHFLSQSVPTKPKMTEKEVRQLQALEGYRDESGITFWTGKLLSDYLAARLKDKVITIEHAQS